MATYEQFAHYYDALMDTGSEEAGDPLANAARVRGYLARHRPAAGSLLDLGCGTGSILAGLRSVSALTGLDRSPQMLARARARVPRARLIAGDITSFELGERFDAVICLFDTLNHLDRFDSWRELFARVASHLHDGGLFAFDVNTVGQLRRLGETAAWVAELDPPSPGARGATVTQDVDWLGDGRATWHVRIEEHLAGGLRACHHERIHELGIELGVIDAALAPSFTLLESTDDDGSQPCDESARAYFAYRRRPRERRRPG